MVGAGVDVAGDGWTCQGRLRGKLAASGRPVDEIAQVEVGAAGGGAPHVGVGTGQHGVPLHGEEGVDLRAPERSAGVSQPHAVGREDEEVRGLFALASYLDTPNVCEKADPDWMLVE